MGKPELVVNADEFDASSVPMYPMLRAEIRELVGGDYAGLLDDQVVATGRDVEPMRTAIIASAAQTASRRLGTFKAVRVRVQAADGGIFDTVVTADGQVYDTTAASASPGGRVAVSGSSASAGRERKGRGRQSSIPTPDAPAPEKRFALHPIVLVIFGFPVLMIAFFVWFFVFRGGQSPATVQAPGAQQLPVVAPQGYSPVARWAVEIGTAVGAGGVSADAQRVYAATRSGDHVTAFDSLSGLQEWSSDLGSTMTAGPTLTVLDGKSILMAATSSGLVALDPESGAETGVWSFDSAVGSQVRITATGPVVTGSTNVAQIIVDGDLVDRVMPAGALPVGPGPEGSLIAASSDRVYASVSSTVSGAGMPIDPASRGAATVAGWTGEELVLAYATTSTTSTGLKLAGYAAPKQADGSWRPLWTTRVPTSIGTASSYGTQLPLITGPSGEWGVYGATVLSLKDGSTSSLGQWSTVSVGDDLAFGAGSTQVLSAGPDGLVGQSDPEPASTPVTAPQAVHGSAAYLVTAGGGTTAWLYALTPTSTSAAPLPTSTPSSSPASASPSVPAPKSTKRPRVGASTSKSPAVSSPPSSSPASPASPRKDGGSR